MKKTILPKIYETLAAVMPIAAILIILRFTLLPEMPWSMFFGFLIGLSLLTVGVFLFSLGADIAMVPIGQSLGRDVTKSNKLWLIILLCFIIGVIITIAEPDLRVFGEQIPNVNTNTFVLIVGIGLGVFLVLGLLRIVFKIKMKYFFAVSYAIIILIVLLDRNSNFISIAFDSSGATTGPISVPFIMSLGTGLSLVWSGKTSEEDSFGMVGICSIGPVLSVLIFGLFSNAGDTLISLEEYSVITPMVFVKALPKYMLEVAVALSPIIIVFIVFQLIYRNHSARQLKKLGIGMLYTFFGVSMFITGANVGFIPVGQYFGSQIAALDFNWILIPIGFVIGVLIISAEPAVHVLKKQIETITGGAIPNKAIFFSLAIGVGTAIALAMIKMLYHINILYFLIPGYLIAIALTFFVPEIFTAIAFDSGGVASGIMAATFIVPFTMGVYLYNGEGSLVDSFGAIALVAMMPIITIQIMGLIYKIKTRKKKSKVIENDDTVVELVD